MISSLAAQYSPDDLAFYLLDFKEGVSFAQFAPGPQPGDLAAARQADRRQHQHRPRVRAGPAAVPLRGDAPAGRGGQGGRREQARGAAPLRGRAPAGRAAAADRGRDRRVPVPVRRERRGDQGVGRAAGGRRPARPLAGHPPRAGQPGHLRHPGVLGSPRGVRAVRAADRAAAGAPGAGRHQRRRGRAAALARRGQRPVRDQARQPDRADPGRLDQGPGRGGGAAAARAVRRPGRRRAGGAGAVRRQPLAADRAS